MALSAPFPAGFGTLLEGKAQGKGSISGGSALGKDAFPALCAKLLAEACLPACQCGWRVCMEVVGASRVGEEVSETVWEGPECSCRCN